MSKYKAKKTVVDGIEFDSKKEANRYCELKLLEKAGAIQHLTRQTRFVLIPSQIRDGKTVEKACTYLADFTYYENGKRVVEDVKGYRKGEAYRLFVVKRKLMLQVHNIRVKEI